MLNHLNTRIRLVLSTILFITMFPVAIGGDAWPIEKISCLFAWVFLVPLWITLRHEPARRIRFWGYLFCFLSTLGTLFWFYIAMKRYGEMPGWQSILILIGAGVLVGTIRWFAFAITAKFQHIRYFPLFAAVIFTLVEWSMMYIPFEGFPWITPAYAIIPMHHFVQTVDLFGTTGMNFLIFLTNFLIIEFFVQKKRGEVQNKKPLMAMVAVFILGTVYGIFQIAKYKTTEGNETLNVALLQGNIAQDIKWSPKDREDIINIYQELTTVASQSNPDLIVWPEASLPQTIRTDREKIDVIPPEVTSGSMIIGAPTFFKKDGKTKYQNSAFTIDSQGNILHRYDKTRLVPFGEYIPNFGFLPVEKFIPAMAGDFSKGSLDQEISQVKNHPFGLFICFEALFPEIARAWVDHGAEFFVIITNDAWFDRSSGPFQHLRFGIMRAIEFRKPIVRAANTGITTWFDATGQQFKILGLFERGYILASIQPNKVRTLYARFPHAIPAILWLLTLYIIGVQRKRTA